MPETCSICGNKDVREGLKYIRDGVVSQQAACWSCFEKVILKNAISRAINPNL